MRSDAATSCSERAAVRGMLRSDVFMEWSMTLTVFTVNVL